MSLIKKKDVKNHLSARLRKQILLDKLASQPDATAFSEVESSARKANPSAFANDFQAEHSFSGTALAPGDPLTGSIGHQVPVAPKSARA
jgi:hypothetical protein